MRNIKPFKRVENFIYKRTKIKSHMQCCTAGVNSDSKVYRKDDLILEVYF